ncbi:vWA domain-containing protein [Thiorhodococcus fuscus]|uniref:VWA domain-containing protein n=1 Tax=Thiorhodococcus fuscus TaxID=527200 RepID=A0ABW4Y6V4_9GAMM
MMGWPATFFVLILFLILGAPNASAAVEVMLALDRSLSMASNDPERNSLKGIEVFSSLLKPDDRFGVLTFANTAELRVSGKNMPGGRIRDDLDAFLRTVKMDGTRTDFGAALRLGYETYARQPAKAGVDRFLVLFTDGQLNLGNKQAPQAARQAIFDEIIPLYRAARIRIFGIAFSSEADLGFLDQLAEATGGQSFRTERSEDLYAAFVQLFEQVDIPLTMPIVGDEIVVDANVQGLELLVKRGPSDGQMRLTDPSNRELKAGDHRPGVEWQSFDDFDHIRIQNPEAGAWKLTTTSTDKTAYIESDLDVDADIPLRVQGGTRVTVTALLTNRAPGSDPALLTGARLEARIYDASTLKQPPVSFESVSMGEDGHRYRGTLLFASTGYARVEVTARGRGFQRTKNYQVQVVASAPASDVVSADVDRLSAHGSESLPSALAQRSAAMNLLVVNALVLLVLALVLGVWWWRRRSSGDRDESDLDVGVRDDD